MKHLFISLTILLFVCKNISAQTQPKLSAATKQFLWQLKNKTQEKPMPLKGYAYKTDAQNTLYIGAIIKVKSSNINESDIEALGAHVNTKAGNIWTVHVPVTSMSAFTKVKGIQYIEMDQPATQFLDSARRATHVDSVQKGYGLPQGYSGKNVVVGVVDEGFDYTHPTFYDTLYQNYRIKRVWEEKISTGTAPTEFGFNYGTELTDSASILAKKNDAGASGTGSHGTHVTGIAAGSGYGSLKDRRFRGMSYGSDIALVAINPSSSYWLSPGMTDMIDGINYLFQYGTSVGKPVVVNMSWGCPMGPRDGTSLFSQAINNLVGKGKIFVISAGNNGTDLIHLKKIFSSTDTLVNSFVTFPAGTSANTIVPGNMIDAWGDTSKTFCIKFSLYNAGKKVDSTAYFCLDDSTHQITLVGLNNDTFSIILTTAAADYNDKPHMLLQLATNYSSTINENDSLCLTINGKSGKVNLWQGYVQSNDGFYGAFLSNGYSWASNGDSITSISDLATTQNAITVGAYDTKVSFVNVSFQSLYYPGFSKGTIAKFSSLGPTADGRTKPDITAPGMAVASSVSSFDSSFLSSGGNYGVVISKFVSPLNGSTYSYALLQGTSMSSPAAAGIVGLLLEADPNLTPQDVMTVFDETAIIDKYTGTIPANGSTTWGYGKVNAYQAIKKVLENEGIYQLPTSTLNCLLYPNPTNGNYAIDLVSDKSENLTLTVFDISGKQVLTENWQVTAGDNIHEFSLSTYTAGIYFTQLKGESGESTIKIVKQ